MGWSRDVEMEEDGSLVRDSKTRLVRKGKEERGMKRGNPRKWKMVSESQPNSKVKNGEEEKRAHQNLSPKQLISGQKVDASSPVGATPQQGGLEPDSDRGEGVLLAIDQFEI